MTTRLSSISEIRSSVLNILTPALGLFLAAISVQTTRASDDILQIRDDYFWSPAREDYFVARGIAYQVWNPPVGANQSLDQVAYDLGEIKKLRANSVRAEFVWGEVEVQDDVFDWRKPDFLVSQAEKLGLKLFIIIGFQYPPGWFNPDWYGVDDRGGPSNVLNYSHPEAQATYQDYIRRVCERYRDSSAIGAWILGNEYAFFDLWEDPVLWANHRFLGYDPVSLADFQVFLSNRYEGDIQRLNANWQSTYETFDEVEMPRRFPPARDIPGFHDLIQWRKETIGDFVAVGAKAARSTDPNHLITYSMVGGIFNANDANNTAEDGKAIVERCRAAGVPLDFWSVNNYAWAEVGQELRTGDFGIAKYQAQAGLPVMISETGHSSTENLFVGAAERQPQTLPGQVWESLLSGAIGTHIFTWNDRPNFTEDFFLRERGFGIVTPERLPKTNRVFDEIRQMFLRMDEIRIDTLLGGSKHPDPDMQFYWAIDADMGWPQANVENALLWGAFKRLGYQPGLIDDEQFDAGAYRDAPALILSRTFRMKPDHLDQMAEEVIPAGIHLHATFDLPGQFDAYHRPNPSWEKHMDGLFGLDVSNATIGWDSGATNLFHRLVSFQGNRLFSGFSRRYREEVRSLKIWHDIKATSGSTIVNHTGFLGEQNPLPALHFKDHPNAKTAINTFALGDVLHGWRFKPIQRWDFHTRWLRAIYQDYFEIQPKIALSGTNADYIFSDYRICSNGSVLISMLNGHTEAATVQLEAAELLHGMQVENLSAGGILERNSDGKVALNFDGDEFALLYAYKTEGETEQSLLSPHTERIWFLNAPDRVWPSEAPYSIQIGLAPSPTEATVELALERLTPNGPQTLSSTSVAAEAQEAAELKINVTSPEIFEPKHYFPSSNGGAQFQWHTSLRQNGNVVAEATLPVLFNWSLRPIALPTDLAPDQQVTASIAWENLPSRFPNENQAPIDRAPLWNSLAPTESYRLSLELVSDRTVIAVAQKDTPHATGQADLAINLPTEIQQPVTWRATTTPILNAQSVDIADGFEGRTQGEDSPPPLFKPWVAFVHRDSPKPDEGILRDQEARSKVGWVQIQSNQTPDNSPHLRLRRPLQTPIPFPPADSSPEDWSVQFDFKEQNLRRARLGIALEDATGRRWEWEGPYRPRDGGWQRDFTVDFQNLRPGPEGGIPTGIAVTHIAVTVALLDSGETYDVFVDNIRFPAAALNEDFESFSIKRNSERVLPPPKISPWQSYNNSEFGNTRWLNEGVGQGGSEGSQSAFLVIENPPNPGGFAVMGLLQPFSTPWSLPENQSQWQDFTFTCAFREEAGLNCNIELQLKNTNGPNGELSLIRYITPYTSDAITGGWQTVTAGLDQFEIPDYAVGFDPNQITELIVNIQLLEQDRVYVGMFDNIHFNGPDQVEELGIAFTSAPTPIRAPGPLRLMRQASGQLTLEWENNARLQESQEVNAPWIDIPDATSPFQILPTHRQRFYRLR